MADKRVLSPMHYHASTNHAQQLNFPRIFLSCPVYSLFIWMPPTVMNPMYFTG